MERSNLEKPRVPRCLLGEKSGTKLYNTMYRIAWGNAEVSDRLCNGNFKERVRSHVYNMLRLNCIVNSSNFNRKRGPLLRHN